MHQSIPSANIPSGNFLRKSKALPWGKAFLQKHGPRDKKHLPPEYFGRSSQPFLLIGVEILEFCRNQTLKELEGCPTILWSYPLVSVQVP